MSNGDVQEGCTRIDHCLCMHIFTGLHASKHNNKARIKFLLFFGFMYQEQKFFCGLLQGSFAIEIFIIKPLSVVSGINIFRGSFLEGHVIGILKLLQCFYNLIHGWPELGFC